MDEHGVTRTWVDKVLKHFVDDVPENITPLLLLESYRCHTMTSVKKWYQSFRSWSSNHPRWVHWNVPAASGSWGWKASEDQGTTSVGGVDGFGSFPIILMDRVAMQVASKWVNGFILHSMKSSFPNVYQWHILHQQLPLPPFSFRLFSCCTTIWSLHVSYFFSWMGIHPGGASWFRCCCCNCLCSCIVVLAAVMCSAVVPVWCGVALTTKMRILVCFDAF